MAGVRLIPFSAHVERAYTKVAYAEGDCLVFGSESRGLPEQVYKDELVQPAVTIPMPGGKVRSINLATAVGIAMYEALRQVRGW
jgi:tRNA (cytidine/uridine-2'-O-)-methyltransferase